MKPTICLRDIGALSLLVALFAAPSSVRADEGLHVLDLVAGGRNPQSAFSIGVVVLHNGNEYLHVEYRVDAPWCLTETHLELATSVVEVPQTRKGNPILGKFSYKGSHGCVAGASYPVPLTWQPGEELVVAAHAEARREVFIDGAATFQYAGAWVAGHPFSGRTPATFGLYSVQAQLDCLGALNATAGDAKVVLSWTVAGAGGVDLYRSTEPNGPYTRLAQLDANTLGYVDTDVSNGSTYHYVVGTINSHGIETCRSAVLTIA
jgi:hypothetical protein